jgi:hypothetical protein
MFTNLQNRVSQEKYKKMLKATAALSGLFSESDAPYLAYRAVENVFCKAFDADNLSRSDCSADAAKNGTGIGIKTFLNGNGKTLQKVAEFNSEINLYKGKGPREIVDIISGLRNKRLSVTKRIYNLKNLIYHCVARKEGQIVIFECPMDEIEIENIKNVKAKEHTISFEDSKNEYSFNMSKSTLYKRFYTQDIIMEFNAEIWTEPYDFLSNMIVSETAEKYVFSTIKEQQHVFLPLFSDKGGRHVPEKSGLNQWNAGGRARDFDEIYVPIPSWIHKRFENFFPPRDKPFILRLPNKDELSVKLCQDSSKALMSNPNAALGQWLLRDILELKEGELLSYDRLKDLGLDSVVIYSLEDGSYSIDFTEIGSYDKFMDEYK